MIRKIFFAIRVIFLFVFLPLLAGEESPVTTFIDKILSNKLQTSDKLSLLSKEYYQINNKDATRLMEYLKTCDKELFIPISELICQEGAYAGEIYELMLKRGKELVSNPEDILPFITCLSNILALRSILPKAEQDSEHLFDEMLKEYEKLSDELLDIINQMPPEKQEKTINILFSGNPNDNNGFMQLLLMTNSERFIRKSLEGINSGNENNIKSSLLILSKIDLSTHFSDESFLSKIAALTRHNNTDISTLSNEILEHCTGIKGGNDFNWSDWLRKNPTPTREDIAMARLKNPNLPPEDRINAIDHICIANYRKWNVTNNAFKIFITIFQDENAPLSLRRELLGRIICISSDSTLPETERNKIKTVAQNIVSSAFKSALENKDEDLLMMMISAASLSSLRLPDLDSEIRNNMYMILADNSYKKDIQFISASGLSQVKTRRKEAAQKLLDFYKRNEMFNYDELDPRLIEILLPLQKITGKSAQEKKTLKLIRSLEYWREAVSKMPDDPPEEK